MSEDPDKTTERDLSEARGAELRENIALTDARRTEEERAKAEEEAAKASKRAEELAETEKRELEKAERLHAEAERERAQASGTAFVPPRVAEKLPPAAQRTEVLVGGAFVGSFLVARVLKRIFD